MGSRKVLVDFKKGKEYDIILWWIYHSVYYFNVSSVELMSEKRTRPMNEIIVRAVGAERIRKCRLYSHLMFIRIHFVRFNAKKAQKRVYDVNPISLAMSLE